MLAFRCRVSVLSSSTAIAGRSSRNVSLLPNQTVYVCCVSSVGGATTGE